MNRRKKITGMGSVRASHSLQRASQLRRPVSICLPGADGSRPVGWWFATRRRLFKGTSGSSLSISPALQVEPPCLRDPESLVPLESLSETNVGARAALLSRCPSTGERSHPCSGRGRKGAHSGLPCSGHLRDLAVIEPARGFFITHADKHNQLPFFPSSSCLREEVRLG